MNEINEAFSDTNVSMLTDANGFENPSAAKHPTSPTPCLPELDEVLAALKA